MLTTFLPLQVYGIFFRRSKAPKSTVLDRILPKFELVLDIMAVLITCKIEEDLIKNKGARVLTITLWELSLAMETRVPIRSGPKPDAAFYHPNDASNWHAGCCDIHI